MELPIDEFSSSPLYEIISMTYCLRQNIGQLSFVKSNRNITPTQVVILMYLHVNLGKDIYQRDIENKFSMRRSTITGVMTTMEDNGLIYREHVKEDARLKRICLTANGLSLIQTITNGAKQVEHTLISGISKRELSTFMQVSEKMKRNLIK